MASNAELSIKLLLENKEALTSLQKSVGDLQAKSKASADSANLSWTALASKFYLVQNAIQPLVGFMTDAIRAAMESEDAVNRLNVALKNQGYYTESLSREYQIMANELRKSTRFSDEAIMQVQQTLVTFGNVAPSQIERVTKAVLDFATAKRIDADTAANLFAKALAGNTSALTRYGIVLDATIPKQERGAALLSLIEQKTGGAAAADIKTFAGATAQLGESWNEFMEGVGKFVTKNETIIAGIRGIKTAINELTDALEKVKPEVDKAFSAIQLSGAPGAGTSIGQSIIENTKGMESMLSGLTGVMGGLFSNGPALGGQAKTILESIFGGAEAQAAVIDTMQQTADQVRTIADQEALDAKNKLELEIASRLGLERAEIDSALRSTEFIKQLKSKQLQESISNELTALKLKKDKSTAELNLQVALEQAKMKVEQEALIARYKGQIAFASATANAMTALAQLTGNSTIASVAMVIQAVVQAIQTVLTAIAAARAASWDWAGAAAIMGAVAGLMGSAVSVIASLRSAKQNLGSELSASMDNFSSSLPDLSKTFQVPGAATGANVLSPGLLMVGERGPELLNLPRGASVSPLDRVGGATNNISIVINISNPSGKIDDDLMDRIKTEISAWIDQELKRL